MNYEADCDNGAAQSPTDVEGAGKEKAEDAAGEEASTDGYLPEQLRTRGDRGTVLGHFEEALRGTTDDLELVGEAEEQQQSWLLRLRGDDSQVAY